MHKDNEAWVTAIRQLMEQPGYRPLTKQELARTLRISDTEHRPLRLALQHMETAGSITRLRKNRWVLAKRPETVTGQISLHADGFGFVTPATGDGPDLFIPQAWLNGALHGDRVEVALQSTGDRPAPRAGRSAAALREGRIVSVVQRRQADLVGLFMRGPAYDYIIPDNPRIPANVQVRAVAPGVKAPPPHHKVVVRLDPWQAGVKIPAGVLTEVLGEADAPGVDVLSVARGHQFTARHPAPVERQARAIRPVAHAARPPAGRQDLRRRVTFTIDPVDAKDFDDALSLEPAGPGLWRMGVHIADVAHYVAPGSEIDREALARGTSVYMVDRTLPMLPGHLTTEVCSLNPGVDRLTHTVDLLLDDEGQVLEHETFPSLIHSHARLTYEQAQLFLDTGKAPGIPAAVQTALTGLRELARAIRAGRMARGSIDFNLPEIKCELDAAGRPLRLVKKPQREANQIVEEFMLLANQVVARKITGAGYPGIYRIHEPPDEEQWLRMRTELHALGIAANPRSSPGVNKVAHHVRGQAVEYAANLAMLRNFKQACYAEKPGRHFGLGFDDYTHFTSPIRRYPDLLAHRILLAVEQGAPAPYTREDLAAMARQCSLMEREALDCERESLDIKRLQYYQGLLSQGARGPYPALVTGLAQRGVLVELVETQQRGVVRFPYIDADYYVINSDRTRATGRQHHREFNIGMVLGVEILAVDERERVVDFRLAVNAQNQAQPAHPGRRQPAQQQRSKQRHGHAPRRS